EFLRLGPRALDLFQQALAVARAHDRQVRLDVLVSHQLLQEVDVAGLGAPQRDAHGEGAATGSRRGNVTAPQPSPTPPTTSARPPSSCQVSGSPSKHTPYSSAVIGSKYVTRLTRAAPSERNTR